MSGNKYRYIAAFIVFVTSFIIYVITLAPTVWFIDNGELAYTAASLGIAHPTGYPLFTIFGRIITVLVPAEPVFKLNVMCAVFVSVSLVIFFFIYSGIFRECCKKEPEYVNYILSFTSVLILGFTLTIWDFATSVEVYPLQMLFYSILLLLIFIIRSSKSGTENKKLFILFFFVLGLSFNNHLNTVIIIPAAVYLMYTVKRKLNCTLKKALYFPAFFILGLSVYIYLPVRNRSVLFNWGDPGCLTNLYRHVKGEQYIRFKSSTGILNSFTEFAEKIPQEFTIPAVILIAAGVIYLLTKDKKIFTFLLLIIITNIIVTSFYNIPDISNYYLLTLISLSTFSLFGLIYFYILIKPYFKILVYVFPLIALLPLTANFSRADKSDIEAIRTFSNNISASVDENSVLLTSKWDYIVSPFLYYQNIENFRNDIIIIDIKLVKTSWYVKYLIKAYPDLYSLSKSFFDTHLKEAENFEEYREGYLNPKTQQDVNKANNYRASYMNLLNSIIDSRPGKFYSTYEVYADTTLWIFKDHIVIPQGILLKYTKNDTLIEFDDLNKINYTLPSYDNQYISAMRGNYLASLINKSKYLVKNQDKESALKLLNKALEIDPDYTIAKDLLRKLE